MININKENKAMEEAVLHAVKDAKSTYGILHEVGHLICGWSCCREHAEFEAHGAAKVIARVLDIDIDLGKAEKAMDCYAGWSSHEACGRMTEKKAKKRRMK